MGCPHILCGHHTAKTRECSDTVDTNGLMPVADTYSMSGFKTFLSIWMCTHLSLVSIFNLLLFFPFLNILYVILEF